MSFDIYPGTHRQDLWCWFIKRSVKIGSRHHANCVLIGGSGSSRCDNYRYRHWRQRWHHGVYGNYSDVIMAAMASQIISLTSVYSTIYAGADQRKHQSFTSLALVRGIHRRPVNSTHKSPVTQKIFPFDDVCGVSVVSMVATYSVIYFWSDSVYILVHYHNKYWHTKTALWR